MSLDSIDASGISGDVTFKPVEALYDPVSKLRVSQPEALIDTDFEYGLQATRWETLELVNNIPTFFARQGDDTLTFGDIQVTNGSNKVTVTTGLPHNLNPGSPIIVIGTTKITCDGTFIVDTVPSATIFTYRAKNALNITGSVKDTYTEIYPGSVYQGSLFDIDDLVNITTEQSANSQFLVETTYPSGLIAQTSLYMLNSIGTTKFLFNANTEVTVNGYATIAYNVVANTKSGSGNTDYEWTAIQPTDYKATNTFTFGTYSKINSSLILKDFNGTVPNVGEYWLYAKGATSNNIDTTVIDHQVYYINGSTNNGSAITLVLIGPDSAGAYGNTINFALGESDVNVIGQPHAFFRVYPLTAANTSTGRDSVTIGANLGWSALQNNPVVFVGHTAGSGNVSSYSRSINNRAAANYKIYYSKQQFSAYEFNYGTSTGGSITNLAANNVQGGFLMPVSTIASKNTIRYANHGFTDNDIVTLTLGTGTNTVPQTLALYSNYVVRKYDNDRFKLLSVASGNEVEIQDVGTANLLFSSKRAEANNESIYYANHGMTDGTAVIYTTEGNTAIGGLSNGFTYYVFASTTDRFKLANTSNGYSTANLTVVQNTTFVTLGATANVFLANLHGYSTGKGIKYTASVPIGGLKSGQHYFVKADTTNTFTLFWSSAGATSSNTADVVPIGYPLSGNGIFLQAEMFDLTTASQGTQLITNENVGSSDGVYTINATSNSTSFTMYAGKAVFNRIKNFSGNSAVNLTNSAIFIPDHRMRTGTQVTYSTTGSAIGGGLANNTNYYVIKLTNDWVYLSYTKTDALLSQNLVNLSTTGSGVHTLSTNSMIGEPLGYGNVNVTANTKSITGNGTNFTAYYKKGSSLKIYYPGNTALLTCTDANTTNGTFIVNAAHNMSIDGTAIKFNTNTGVSIQTNTFYYVNVSNTVTPTNQFRIYNTYFDAINSDINGIVVPATGGAGISITANAFFTLGNTFSTTVNAVFSKTSMSVNDSAPANGTGLAYSIKTQLYLRSDGFALHRPYDGGVELIPSTNPSSTMIRQTRKYFRYQSGKGIQVSLAINFSPSTVIDSLTRTSYSGGSATGTVYTRNPHRLATGSQVTISGATDSGWNQSYYITVVDPYTFSITVNQSGGPSGTTAGGKVQYYVNSWNNCALRLGLFDDQNGLFWEYDGNSLYACRRSSTSQLSGTATVSFKSGLVTGSGTLYSSQISAGDYVVIKGQSYKVLQVNSDTSFNISPFYRGTSASNIIVTLTETTRTAQSSWTIDECDGTGPTGYTLDIHKIQMAYIDYSWYGAGKVRFGFKDTEGRVQYVHEFIHNNQKTEAYLRSGNLPCRYEVSSSGSPSYVPALAHWGTSVIMDGRYDDDKAYLFTASGNQLTFTGNSQITFAGYIEGTSQPYVSNNGLLSVGYAVTVITPAATLSSVATGLPISGNNIPAGTKTTLPTSNKIIPYQPYQPSYPIKYANGTSIGYRTLMMIDSAPTAAASAGQSSTYTITAGQDSLVYDIPLISIRLSPSVDSGTIGSLGEREIINRMQLILSSVSILTTHSVEVSLVLNSRIDSSNWVRVNPPSLSQVIYHDSLNSSTSGVKVYSFRAQGSSGNTARTQTATSLTLGEVATLGNAILGGDNAYPDGPDVLTITARLVEDPSTVTATNPFQITGRISWTESQA
jgi:hypothetical protein